MLLPGRKLGDTTAGQSASKKLQYGAEIEEVLAEANAGIEKVEQDIEDVQREKADSSARCVALSVYPPSFGSLLSVRSGALSLLVA
jgi:hypothetical protein